MDWSARQYTKFEDARTRPVRDLLSAIPRTEARRAVDLGCGPGNSTELLQAAYPDADVTGIDTSADMLAAAQRRLPHARFATADIATWCEAGNDPGSWDVMLANASLQWVPDHATLLPRLVQRLAQGGSLAVQMPDNVEEPVQQAMRRVAAEAEFAPTLSTANAARKALPAAAWYYRLLQPHCARVDIWRTTYHHRLEGGADGIVEWFKGSALQPFLAPLDAAGRAAFLARYREEVAEACPMLPDGSVLLPFPRLFIVATK